MARYLLDADAVIDFLAGFPPSVIVIRQLHVEGNVLCVCNVVVAEVYAGLHANRELAAEEFLGQMTHLTTSADAAKQAGKWRLTFRRRGQTLSITDMLIAATAVEHDATVVTGNWRHFPMNEVRVLPLPRPLR